MPVVFSLHPLNVQQQQMITFMTYNLLWMNLCVNIIAWPSLIGLIILTRKYEKSAYLGNLYCEVGTGSMMMYLSPLLGQWPQWSCFFLLMEGCEIEMLAVHFNVVWTTCIVQCGLHTISQSAFILQTLICFYPLLRACAIIATFAD